MFKSIKHVKPNLRECKIIIIKTSKKLRLGLLEEKKKKIRSHTDDGQWNPTRTKKKTHQVITTSSFMARMIISHPVERFVSLLTFSHISDSATFRGS